MFFLQIFPILFGPYAHIQYCLRAAPSSTSQSVRCSGNRERLSTRINRWRISISCDSVLLSTRIYMTHIFRCWCPNRRASMYYTQQKEPRQRHRRQPPLWLRRQQPRCRQQPPLSPRRRQSSSSTPDFTFPISLFTLGDLLIFLLNIVLIFTIQL